MAVKYVKDFSFPASGGFHGDVQRFAKGGHVTKVPAKAKASAKDMPARAKPNAPAKGAPKMKSEPAKGKRQGYNEGGRVPGYDMDRLPANKPPGRTMDLAPSKPFKGAYEGYADGGDVAPYPSPGKGPDKGEPQMPMPVDDYKPSGPPPPPGMKVNPNYGKPGQDYYVFIDEPIPIMPEPRYMRDVEAGLDRGMRPGQMARQQRIEDRINAQREAMMRPRYRIPEMPPELPGIIIDEGREYAMPVPGPGPLDVALPGMAMVAPPSPGRYAKGGKVQKVMREYKEGKLHSGSKKGPLVKNREQAVAIALSEARKAGAKIPKKAEGGIFNDEAMAYQSKGPKTRYTPAKGRREARERAMERRAREAMERAEKFAPGMSLDMPDRKAKGGMMKGKKFPDLTGDGKVTRADVLKGRGVIKDRKMPTHNRKPMYGKG
jgi:Family of unknown function (DUF6496)